MSAYLRGIALLAGLLLFGLIAVLNTSGEAIAQIPGTSGANLTNPVAGATPGDTNAAGSGDSDLWRAIRQGETFNSSGQDPQAGRLIQSEGHYWEETRNGPLAMYVAWAMTGMLVLLCLFFALRGRIKIEDGWSGRLIQRFNLLERVGHWLTASSFVILALTGLNLLFGRKIILPLIGHDAFSVMTIWGKHIHNYVALAFVVGLVLIFVMWVVHNIPAPRDLNWLIHGGGLFGGHTPPAKKFNAGQKMIFWAVILCGASLTLSGWALLNPFSTHMFAHTFGTINGLVGTGLPTDLTMIQEQQFQQIWHVVMAGIMVCVIFAHIYIGTVGMEGALPAMTSGDVDLNWAKEHHSLWVEENPEKIHRRIEDDPVAQPAE